MLFLAAVCLLPKGACKHVKDDLMSKNQQLLIFCKLTIFVKA